MTVPDRTRGPAAWPGPSEGDVTAFPPPMSKVLPTTRGVRCCTRPSATDRHGETDDRITVFFREYGYRDLALDAVRQRDLLRPAEAHKGA